MFFKQLTEEEVEYARVQRLLRDFPWLWAIRQSWTQKTRASVEIVHEEDVFLSSPIILEQLVCYVHVVSPMGEQVLRFGPEKKLRDMLTVFRFMRDELKTPLEFVKHVAHERAFAASGYAPFLFIYRAKSFKEIFDRHPSALVTYEESVEPTRFYGR